MKDLEKDEQCFIEKYGSDFRGSEQALQESYDIFFSSKGRERGVDIRKFAALIGETKVETFSGQGYEKIYSQVLGLELPKTLLEYREFLINEFCLHQLKFAGFDIDNLKMKETE